MCERVGSEGRRGDGRAVAATDTHAVSRLQERTRYH